MLPPFMRGVEALVTPATGLHAQYYMLLRTLAAQGVQAPWQRGRPGIIASRPGPSEHRLRKVGRNTT